MTDVRREPRSRRLRPLRLVALGAVFALVAAACGSGRNNAKPPTNATLRGAARPGSTSVIDASQCDPSTLTQGVSGNTIKLGTSLPLSGTYSAFNAILMGESAYFSYLTAQGGVTVAGKKYMIDLVSKDDAYDRRRRRRMSTR